MNRRAFLAKTTIAAAGLCTLPLMAQTDLSLDLWKDTERALRHELLEAGFNHVYHHAGCGHVLFYSERTFEYGEFIWPTMILPNGAEHKYGESVHCRHCDSLVYPKDGAEVFHVEVK